MKSELRSRVGQYEMTQTFNVRCGIPTAKFWSIDAHVRQAEFYFLHLVVGNKIPNTVAMVSLIYGVWCVKKSFTNILGIERNISDGGLIAK